MSGRTEVTHSIADSCFGRFHNYVTDHIQFKGAYRLGQPITLPTEQCRISRYVVVRLFPIYSRLAENETTTDGHYDGIAISQSLDSTQPA